MASHLKLTASGRRLVLPEFLDMGARLHLPASFRQGSQVCVGCEQVS